MKVELINLESDAKIIFKKCHVCGHLMESAQELQKCKKCRKSFLPVNYFSKVHSKSQNEFSQLFAYGHEIHEDDLIKGLYVLW